jgi:HAE1 family hydrophobic/amphiphilic exporter-1
MAMVAATFTGIHAQSPPAQPSQPAQPAPSTQPAATPQKPLSGAVGEPVPVQLPARVGIAQGADEALTLEGAIRLTLEQNNDVEVARLDVSSARQQVRAAEGVFDPRIIPNFSYEHANTANASSLGGATQGRVTQKELFGGVQFAGRSPRQGGEFVVDFTQTRLVTSNQFSRLNPQFPSLLNFSFTQPLLRDRAIDQERRQILLSKKNVDLTDSQLRSVVTEQLTFVEQAYWDLVFAKSNLEVQTSALAQARGQVASNERQVEAGTLAPIDVVEAQTQVSRFELTVASAQQSLTEAENRLKSLMLRDRTAPQWNHALTPADLRDRPTPSIGVDEAMKLALAKRPELAASNASLARNDIDRQFFENQALPQVNLTGAYTLRGLAGASLPVTSDPLSGSDAVFFARLNELAVLAGLTPLAPPQSTTSTVPSFFVGGTGTSLGNLFDRRFQTALIQIQMEIPLRNRTAQANVARAGIQRQQLERQRLQLEQIIEAEVRNTLQAVQSSERRLAAAASAQRNAREQYESERRRFDSGLSTVFLVLERQTTLVTTQAAELRARADLNQAIALFHRAVGGTFDQHGITLP